MKKHFLILFIGFSTFLFSQNQLEKGKDSARYFIKEIKTNKQISQEVKENYATKILLLTKDAHDSLKFRANIEIALMYFKKRDLDSLKKYSLISEKHANKLNDLLKIQKAHFYLATYYKYKQIPDSAYYHYNSSKNILLKLGDTITAGRRMFNVSVVQLNEQDLLGSENTAIASLKYLEKSNLNKIKADLYNNLGLVARQRKEFKESLNYFKLSLKILKRDKKYNIGSELNVINNIAALYSTFNNFEKSIEHYNKGLSYKNIKNYPYNYSTMLEGKANCNFRLGNDRNVLKNYFEALKIKKNRGDYKQTSNTYNNIAFYYKDKKNTKKAIEYANLGLEYGKKSSSRSTVLRALRILSSLTIGKQSKEYLENYIQLKDSLYNRERTMKNQFAKIRYETDKKEQENTVLKSDNEKKQAQLESEKLQKTIGLISTGGAIGLLGLSFLVFRNRRKRILFQTQLEKAEVREKERQQIAKSLHDEVAGDLRMLHLKLANSNQMEEAKSLNTIKENVRNLSHQLSSESFEEVSFKDQIINLVSDYFEIDFRIKVEGIDSVEWKETNKSIKRTLFLSIRESIQNAKKHAKASKLNLTFSETKKAILLVISDNGVGFNVDEKKNGIGLKNLKERVEEINGTFIIESELKKGTNTKIEIAKNGK